MMTMGHPHHKSEGDKGVNSYRISGGNYGQEVFQMCPPPPPPRLPSTTENHCCIPGEPHPRYFRFLEQQRCSWWQLWITAPSGSLGSRDHRNVRLPVDSSWNPWVKKILGHREVVAGPHSKQPGSSTSGRRGLHSETEGRNPKGRPTGCLTMSVYSKSHSAKYASFLRISIRVRNKSLKILTY